MCDDVEHATQKQIDYVRKLEEKNCFPKDDYKFYLELKQTLCNCDLNSLKKHEADELIRTLLRIRIVLVNEAYTPWDRQVTALGQHSIDGCGFY